LKGRDLTRLPLVERRTLLNSLSFKDKRIKIVDYVEASATDVLAAVRQQRLEGIIGKRKDSLYESGKRTGAWVKYRVNRGQELVIGGYTPGLHGLDAIIVGYFRDKQLVYVSRTRNGFVPASRRQLFEKLKPLVIQECPFVNLPEMDGEGQINLLDVVKTSVTEDGRLLRQGFFLTKEAGNKFVQRARAKGLQVIERGVPKEIVIDATYTITLPFAFSLSARKVVAKIALAAIAHELGCPFALMPQFDSLRRARSASGPQDLRVWIFANEGLMSAHRRAAHQHNVLCYLSAGMGKGWALVTLFGGISYLEAVYEQWHPIISAFCAQKGVTVERLGDSNAGT
jgi:hypothetical protein